MSSSNTQVSAALAQDAQKSEKNYYLYDDIQIPKDEKAAREFIEKMKAAGNVEILWQLGNFYGHIHGKGTEDIFSAPKNLNLAFELYKAATEIAKSAVRQPVLTTYNDLNEPRTHLELLNSTYNSLAQQDLGYCHLKGEGTAINYQAAMQCFHSALILEPEDKLNLFEAVDELATAYRTGRGLPKNIHRAILLTQFSQVQYVQANFRGPEWLNNPLKSLYQMAPDFPQTLTPDTNYLGQDKLFAPTIHHYSKLAEQGNVIALNLMGFVYELGIIYPQNLGLALKCYRAAVEKGDSRCLIDIHRCLHQLPVASPLKTIVAKIPEALKPSDFLKLYDRCLKREQDNILKAHLLFMMGDFHERNLLNAMFNTFQASQCYSAAQILNSDDPDIRRKNRDLLPIWALKAAIVAGAPVLDVGRSSIIDVVSEYAFEPSNNDQKLK